MNKKDIEQNQKARNKFRAIGFLLLIPGIILVIIGMVSLFSAAATFGTPSLFFCCFIGLPLIFGGAVCLNMGYMGSVARYTSKEISPVVKDTANYLLDGTKEQIASTINEVKKEKIKCSNCGEFNSKDAKYCDNCGKLLVKTCRYCGEENDSDAKYCNSCGRSID
ncbi:MAG: zinc ribbon domain-containing protein [Bacilli bacterium]|nr:zinc ribbon domain-containing protein [Bacilli bacterium]